MTETSKLGNISQFISPLHLRQIINEILIRTHSFRWIHGFPLKDWFLFSFLLGLFGGWFVFVLFIFLQLFSQLISSFLLLHTLCELFTQVLLSVQLWEWREFIFK